MSEKRRSNSIDKSPGSDTREEGFHQDVVSVTTSPSVPLSYASRRISWLERCKPSDKISWKLLPMPRR